MKRRARLPLAFALGTVALAVHPAPGAQDRIVVPAEYEVTMARNHHADLSAKLTSTSTPSLARAWAIETPTYVSHTPLVVGGRVYFADWDGRVYAADLQTGRVLWKRDIAKPQKMWPWHGFAGTGAIGGGLLYEASVEGMAYGIDLTTGEVKWKHDFAEDDEAGNVGKLLYHDGLLYIGVSSVEEPLTKMKEGFTPDFQGKVIALDASSGKRVWERQLVTAPQNGVPVWSGFALDPSLKMLYFSTGNNYTGKSTPLSDAVVAVDSTTGEIRWARQFTQNDVWTMAQPLGPDYDFGAAPQLFEAVIDGTPRRLVGAGQKSGYFWVMDRSTGDVVWNTTVGYGHVGGGMHAEASIGRGRIFLWGNNAFPYTNPEQHPMDVKAVDASTGNYLWSNPKAQPAVLISAGFATSDAYFVGSLDGRVRAYDASNGKLIWTSPAMPPVAGSLWVTEDTLLVPVGVPAQFGGIKDTRGGVYAFRPGGGSAGPGK